MAKYKNDRDAELKANMEKSLKEITIQLEELKADIATGKQLSLGKIKFLSGMLDAQAVAAGSW